MGIEVRREVEKFLSTLSLRRATGSVLDVYGGEYISIHALLAESDFTCARRLKVVYYFYPRSPCGERLQKDGNQQNGQ